MLYRKIIFILLLCIGVQSLNAQYRYKFESRIEVYDCWGGSNTSVNLSLVVAPNTSGQSLINYVVSNCPIETYGIINDRIINSSVEYTHINKRINGSNSQVPIRCWQGTELDNYIPALAGFGDRLIVYQIKPFSEVNNYSAANNILLECEPTTLKVTDNIDCSGISMKYGVQYQVGTSTVWSNLYAYGTRSSNFSINMADFPGLTVGQNLRLRLQYDEPTAGAPSYSDILTYSYGRCTPNVTGFTTQATTCSNTTDGRFTLNFDRVLNPGETLAMVLRRDSATGPIISSLTGVTYAGTSYIWPNNLPAANYYLRYQTEPTGSVIDVGPITITSPTPVLFTAGWTDVDCFGENTGSISINASGGQGNYQYSINNGANWFPFANATSHNVINLTAGNYQVKVRDGANCVAQQ